jgi:hypothetical protein
MQLLPTQLTLSGAGNSPVKSDSTSEPAHLDDFATKISFPNFAG